ncbi:MAG: glycine oxidase ThiO [Corynebacterium sp.]|uniref:glycine oxidase ThiO n=1 Tax=unclassified Corynebacterium TaxID=2624378 RepID=UPI00264CB866|nr:glycine oxidase ThiO [Corynebacterium sp.]
MPDILVVGAGVIGLSTAWSLRQAGHTVTVVDPAPGSGASRAAAGMLAAVSEVVHGHDRIRPLMLASAAAYPEFIAGLEDAVGHPVGYRATATLGVGATRGDVAALSDLAEVQRAGGMSVEQLTVRQARRLEPALSPGIAGAFLLADDHQVDPRMLVDALLEALTAPNGASGAPGVPGPAGTLHRGRVRTVLREDGSGAVTGVLLDDGTRLHADTTVLSPGLALSDIGGLPEAARVALRPVHGDILRARLRPGRPALLERTVRGLVDGRPVYLVPRQDGGMVIGATEREDGFDGVSLEGAHQLLRDAQILVPGAADLELTEMLARARPGTPDDIPYLGPVPGDDGAVDGVLVCTGHSRHGVLLAPVSARLVGALVSDSAGSADPADTSLLATTSLERTLDQP